MSAHAERVRALRRLAAGTPYPDEAEAARRKVLELEERYGPVTEEAPRVQVPTPDPWAGYEVHYWTRAERTGNPWAGRQRPTSWDWPPDPGPAGWYTVGADGEVRLRQAAGPAGAQSAGFQTRFRR